MHYPRAFKAPGTYSPRSPAKPAPWDKPDVAPAPENATGENINRCTGMSLSNSLAGVGAASKFLFTYRARDTQWGFWYADGNALWAKIILIWWKPLCGTTRRPRRIVAYSELKSGYWRGLMRAFRGKLHIITSYHHHGNPAERANRSIQALLCAVLFEAESVKHVTTNGLREYKANQWPKLLPYAVASFYAHPIAGTNISAFQMKHGFEFRLFAPFIRQCNVQKHSPPTSFCPEIWNHIQTSQNHSACRWPQDTLSACTDDAWNKCTDHPQSAQSAWADDPLAMKVEAACSSMKRPQIPQELMCWLHFSFEINIHQRCTQLFDLVVEVFKPQRVPDCWAWRLQPRHLGRLRHRRSHGCHPPSSQTSSQKPCIFSRSERRSSSTPKRWFWLKPGFGRGPNFFAPRLWLPLLCDNASDNNLTPVIPSNGEICAKWYSAILWKSWRPCCKLEQLAAKMSLETSQRKVLDF